MNGLKIKIKGQYNDVFLYGKYLYLLTDEEFKVVHFPKLIKKLFVKNETVNSFLKYAFLRNDFFYDSTNAMFDLLNISEIKKVFEKSLADFKTKDISAKLLKECTLSTFEHDHYGAIHLEVYRDNIFISDEKGTYAYRLVKDELKRSVFLTSISALHIAAKVGSSVYFSCGHNGLMVFDFDFLSKAGKKLDTFSHATYEQNTISTDLAYNDFVFRTIDNDFGYYYNSIAGKGIKLSDYSTEEKAKAYQLYDLKSNDEKILDGKSFSTVYNNRLITMDDSLLNIYKMNYESRMDEKKSGDIFEKVSSFDYSKNKKFNYIYSGHQTVFGLIVDTDQGTYSIDDSLKEEGAFEQNLISRGENVKVRHFYRARNYSHIIASIKNNHLEIFSDLSNYFFPKGKRILRANSPFGRRGESLSSFNWIYQDLDHFLQEKDDSDDLF